MKRTDDCALAKKLLDRCLFITLAMTEPDGGPYCVPLSPVRIERSLYFHCAPKGRKADALRANPKVCLTCVGYAEVIPGQFNIAYESALAFGTAAEVTDSAEKVEALRLISEKYCADDMGDFDQVLAKFLQHTGVWKISLDVITTKG